MARGWDSKSVEEQLDLARQQRERPSGPALSPEAVARNRERERLRLARVRVVEQLARSTNERYTQMLRQELESLDAATSALDRQ